jgi:hypothetical protein
MATVEQKARALDLIAGVVHAELLTDAELAEFVGLVLRNYEAKTIRPAARLAVKRWSLGQFDLKQLGELLIAAEEG